MDTNKSQDNESLLSCTTHRKLYSLEPEQKSPKHTEEEAVADSEMILIQREKYNTEK